MFKLCAELKIVNGYLESEEEHGYYFYLRSWIWLFLDDNWWYFLKSEAYFFRKPHVLLTKIISGQYLGNCPLKFLKQSKAKQHIIFNFSPDQAWFHNKKSDNLIRQWIIIPNQITSKKGVFLYILLNSANLLELSASCMYNFSDLHLIERFYLIFEFNFILWRSETFFFFIIFLFCCSNCSTLCWSRFELHRRA